METATSPMQPKPLVNVTCKLGTKGCFADGRCHALGNCENKITSYADHIRAMSDEELSYAIVKIATGIDPCECFCQNKKECQDLMDADKEIPDEWCRKCVLDMLRRPADHDTAPTMDTSGKEESGLLEEE